MHTPGRMYFYVHVLQSGNFCHIESIFVLSCANLPEDINTVSVKKHKH